MCIRDSASGAYLLAVDGQPISDLGLEGAANALRGEVGTQVVLTLQQGSNSPEELSLERRSVDLRPVRTRRLRTESHPGLFACYPVHRGGSYAGAGGTR